MARQRKAVTQAPKVGLQAEFENHTFAVYGLMTYRFRERRDLSGNVTHSKREIPFTLTEFRDWLLAGPFRGSWDNAVQCPYCRMWMNCMNFVTDHLEPVKYGGSLALENLGVCCEACNCAKGVMSARGFQQLCIWAESLTHSDRADMFGRMKNGAAYIRQKIVSGKTKRPRWRR